MNESPAIDLSQVEEAITNGYIPGAERTEGGGGGIDLSKAAANLRSEEILKQIVPLLQDSSMGVKVEGNVAPKQKYRLYGNGGPVPFRRHPGQGLPDLKNNDDPKFRPQQVMDAKVRVFNMGDPDHLADYQRVADMVAKQRAMISKEEITWSEKQDNYVVFLRWVELFEEMVDNKREPV